MTPVLWIFAAVAALLPQQPASADPAVQLRVAVYTYNADGSVRGSAGGTVGESPDSASLTWVASSSTSCGMGAGALPPRQDAIVWKSSGRIVSHSGNSYTIELDVSRATGTMSEAPVGQKTVAIGEHVLLDQVPSAPGPCGGRTARLEASVELAHPPSADAGRVGGRGGASGGIGNASSGFAGAGGSVVAGPRRASPLAPPPPPDLLAVVLPMDVASVIASAVRTTDDGTGERSFMMGAGQAGAGVSTSMPVALHAMQASFRAEVWLVDTEADGTQQTRANVGHLDDGGSTIRLPPLPIPGQRAFATVAVNLRPMWTSAKQAVLRVVLVRIVGNGQSFGMSNRAIPLPGPGEVVSFEMPVEPAASDASGAHRFEIRVRLTPAG